MIRRATGAIVLATILLGLGQAPVLAESPPPTPTATPQPTPPTPSAPLTPATPTPAPQPERTVGVEEAAALEAARAALEATSLFERLEALRRYTGLQIDALRARERSFEEERARVSAQLAATERLVASEQERLDALMRAAYRSTRTSPLEEVLERGSLVDGIARAIELAALAEEHRALSERLRSLRADLDAQRAQVERDAEELSRVGEALRVKHESLRALETRAERLAAAQQRGGDRARLAAELEVIRELAAEQERANAELAEVVARLVPFVAPAPASWSWPSTGAVSQPFGPTLFALEPPLVYEGVRYPHFHAALDIAAALYSPVRAAADGRVSFVGHFSDGAMVVLISHAEGYVSLYAHLDDGARAPVVRVGDPVYAGQPIGAIGLTGITTGPHLHFAVLRGTLPMDPRALLPAR